DRTYIGKGIPPGRSAKLGLFDAGGGEPPFAKVPISAAADRGGPMTTADTSDRPLVIELRPPPDVESALVSLAAPPHSLLLDSRLREPRLGRYSFLTADPFEFITVPADGTDGLGLLEARLRLWRSASRPDLPPFQGGAAGLLSYDLGRSLERIPQPRMDE